MKKQKDAIAHATGLSKLWKNMESDILIKNNPAGEIEEKDNNTNYMGKDNTNNGIIRSKWGKYVGKTCLPLTSNNVSRETISY